MSIIYVMAGNLIQQPLIVELYDHPKSVAPDPVPGMDAIFCVIATKKKNGESQKQSKYNIKWFKKRRDLDTLPPDIFEFRLRNRISFIGILGY